MENRPLELNGPGIESEIDSIVAEHGRGAGALIPILQAIQSRYNYLPEPALRRLYQVTEITPASIAGVSTFYSQFRHRPVGRHIVQVCTGTACHVKGSDRVYDSFCRELHIHGNEDTDPDGLFTVSKVACLGCCTLAPVVQIDQVTYGKVQPDGVAGVIEDFLSRDIETGPAAELSSHPGGGTKKIRIGLGSCCVASGSARVQDALERELLGNGADARVVRVGCVGMCHRVPLLEILENDGGSVLYDRVTPQEVGEIVRRHFPAPTLARRLSRSAVRWLEQLYDPGPAGRPGRLPLHSRDPVLEAFLGRQRHIATEGAGRMDPLDPDQYRALEGFRALERALQSDPEEIIAEISASGLRGRGGAGFPTGEKWRLVRRADDEVKYIVCNGDEGDPGAFMDRMILESYPFRVIEGMVIAAFATGANRGKLYIRAEYPLAVQRVRAAIESCEKEGLLGDNILSSGFSLHLSIMEGAGAFVCGEETALLASIEGRRGMPRFRPPYPSQHGLWGHSTLVNNCETFATVPWILRNGAREFEKMGTVASKGTKVFSLAGKIARGGLIEVPMGITVRQIVEEIGGGIEGGKRFKAVQIGGPSGGCLPASLADTPVDYEALTEAGAMMGSGGLLVLDESDCMVDVARYFLAFTTNQSCGKCTYCRIGTRHMLEILERLCGGRGAEGDLEQLERLAQMTRQGSLCGLGRTAPNPVLSTLKYFRSEYQAHIEGHCPAKKCAALITYSITDDCIGCTLCAQKCPVEAIPLTPYQKHEIIEEKCIRCDTCAQVCPAGAVRIS